MNGVKNVNRLAEEQELTFAPTGVTVVYGYNRSGKSGYARLIQSLVRTRHRPAILPDVFAALPGDQDAVLQYTVAGVAEQASLDASPPVELGRVAFYDETCGDAYLTTEAEVTYRPSTLTLVDDLYQVCTKVREHLTAMLSTNDAEAVALPTVEPGTDAARFLENLSHTTTDTLIDTSRKPEEGDEKEAARLQQEQARLRATDPERERTRLNDLADTYSSAQTVAADCLHRAGANGGRQIPC